MLNVRSQIRSLILLFWNSGVCSRKSFIERISLHLFVVTGVFHVSVLFCVERDLQRTRIAEEAACRIGRSAGTSEMCVPSLSRSPSHSSWILHKNSSFRIFSACFYFSHCFSSAGIILFLLSSYWIHFYSFTWCIRPGLRLFWSCFAVSLREQNTEQTLKILSKIVVVTLSHRTSAHPTLQTRQSFTKFQPFKF